MISVKTPIVIAGIGLALIILFFSISKFGLPLLNEIGKSAGDTLGGLSTGITDFFSSFDDFGNIDIRTDESDDPFFTTGEESVGSPQELIEQLDSNSPTFQEDAISILESLGITGVDSVEITESGGLHIIQNDDDTDEPFDIFKVIEDAFSSLFPSVPEANAVEQTTPSQSEMDETPQGSTSIEGIVISQLDTDQDFEVFSSDSSQSVTGVIRETEQDPLELQVDSLGNPTETASERANRIFEETGEFADVDSGATSVSETDPDFDFGTNTGSSTKVDTDVNAASDEDLTLAERLKIEAEKAALIYGSYSNF